MTLIKLLINAVSTVNGGVSTTTVPTIVPVVRRYTDVIVLGNIIGSVTTIPAQSFTDDNGNAVPAGGLTTATSSGYYNVFVNGTLLRGGLTTLTSASLVINTALVVGVTVCLEVINFTSSAISTSTNDISVDTTVQT